MNIHRNKEQRNAHVIDFETNGKTSCGEHRTIIPTFSLFIVFYSLFTQFSLHFSYSLYLYIYCKNENRNLHPRGMSLCVKTEKTQPKNDKNHKFG